MPVASRLVLLAVLLLASLVLACGGGDDDDDGDGGSESTETRTATPSGATATSTPTPGADEKTPGPDETPGPEESSGATPGGATAPPPAAQGTPAVEPADSLAYLAQFQGRSDLGEEGCSYNPSTRVTDCGIRGIYSVRPPLPGQDISCFITIVGGNLEFIRCTSVQPSVTKWYEIQ
jgi:hypothetical protein